MRNFRNLFVLGLALLALTTAVRADDDAKDVIKKAIKAHGGEDVLKKNRVRPGQFSGEAHIEAEGLELTGTMQMTAVMKDNTYRFRQDLNLKVMDMELRQSVGFDGKELWITLNDQVFMTYDSEDDIKLIRESNWAEEASDLVVLFEPGVELAIVGEDKVGDHPVVGVRVSKKGFKDVLLYFDQKTYLLRKVQNQSLDFMSRKEVEQERILDDYTDLEGQKIPKKLTFFQDGKKLLDLQVKEMKLLDHIEEGFFSRPK